MSAKYLQSPLYSPLPSRRTPPRFSSPVSSAFHPPPPPPTLPCPGPCPACGVAPTAERRRSLSRPPWAQSLLRYLPSLPSAASPLFPPLPLRWALRFYFMIDADGPTRSVDVLQARAQDLPELRRARASRLLRQRHLPPHHQGIS